MKRTSRKSRRRTSRRPLRRNTGVPGAVFSVREVPGPGIKLYELTVRLEPPVVPSSRILRWRRAEKTRAPLDRIARQMTASLKRGASVIFNGWVPVATKNSRRRRKRSR